MLDKEPKSTGEAKVGKRDGTESIVSVD